MADKKKSLRHPTMEVYQSQPQEQQPKKPEKPPTWTVVRGFLSCKQLEPGQKHQQQKHGKQQQRQLRQNEHLQGGRSSGVSDKKGMKMKCSGSLCSNTKVIHRSETPSPEFQKKRAQMSSKNDETSSRSSKTPLHQVVEVISMPPSSVGGSFKVTPFRRLSGCYECRMVVDPVLGIAKDSSLRSSICSCPECGQIFMKAENLELHLAVKHAVSEMGPEDTSKNIVEIIFQSSWLKKQTPICKIDRILKVRNTQKTISKFEAHRDFVRSKAQKLPKKHPRCIADGNELLRFHCTTFSCSLGLSGSSNLCNSIPRCNACNIIKNGFKVAGDIPLKGILTTATSGRAHAKAEVPPDDKNDNRAMLVCRVIAGRVKKSMEGSMEEYDSVAEAGVYTDFDELLVFNPRAILPCFVVIYRGF